MSEISQECRAMATQMLDAELMAILRKLKEDEELTQLQTAVLIEIEKRHQRRRHSHVASIQSM